MTYYAYERVKAGLSMPGVIEVADDLPIGKVIKDILLLAEYSERGEWDGRVIYLHCKIFLLTKLHGKIDRFLCKLQQPIQCKKSALYLSKE